jgi:transmembrane sensor
MILQDFKTIEELVCDESFLNFYFQDNEKDVLDWEDWHTDYPDREMLVKDAFLLIDRLSLKFDETQVKEKLKKFQSYLNEKDVTGKQNDTLPISDSLNAVPSKLRFHKPLKIAAAIAVLIVASFFIFHKNGKKSLQNASNTEGGIALTTQYVENKSIAKVSVFELSDGSIVRLNTGSSIRLADNFGLHSRDIYLEGEGYFVVAKDAEKPFHVYAGKSVTTAIGTAFTVRAFKGEKSVKILLLEGKVRVENTDENTPSVELIPKQQVLMYDNKIFPVENIANVDEVSRWKDGYIMTFKETPFKDVIKTLSEYYRTPIHGFEETSLADAKITAEFDKKDPLSTIMEALAFANKFDFMVKKDTFFIIKKDKLN